MDIKAKLEEEIKRYKLLTEKRDEHVKAATELERQTFISLGRVEALKNLLDETNEDEAESDK